MKSRNAVLAALAAPVAAIGLGLGVATAQADVDAHPGGVRNSTQAAWMAGPAIVAVPHPGVAVVSIYADGAVRAADMIAWKIPSMIARPWDRARHN